MKLLIAMMIGISFFNYESTGRATYYGEKWTGRLTSSSEKFHADSMTCAHKTLPFGTLLEVTDTKTNKQIIVKVNDRLPKNSIAIIDLSYGAAKQHDMIERGVATVKLKSIGTGIIYK